MIDLLDLSASRRHFDTTTTQDLFTSSQWISIVADAYGIAIHAILDRARDATLPLALMDDLAGRRLIGLPFSDYMLLPIELDTIISLAERALDQFPDYRIMMRVALNAPVPAMHGQWNLRPSAVYHRVDITSEEALWQGLSQSFRNQVRQGWRHGVTAQLTRSREALERFIAMHTSLRNRKFMSLPQPQGFFHLIYERLIASGDGFFIESLHGDDVIASCLVLAHANVLYYKFSASTAEASEVRGNNVMLWELLRTAAATGHFRAIDLGRSGLGDGYAGLRHFKESLGASPHPILAMDHPARKPDDQAAKRATEFLALVKETTRLIASARDSQGLNDAAAQIFYRYFA
jgi:hypothetical protein